MSTLKNIPWKYILLASILIVNLIPISTSHDLNMSSTSNGSFYYVGGSGPGNYSTIQEAINVSQSGDTVFVYQGIYYEHLIVDKSLTMIGEKQEQTIIHGSNMGDNPCITSIGSNILIDNFTIVWADWEHHEPGIRIYSDNTIVKNCNISNHDKGIILTPSAENCTISNNIFYNIHEGIWLWQPGSHKHLIQNNIFTNNNFGIKLSLSTNNIIKNNTFIKHSSIAILLQKSHDNIFYQNTFTKNSRGIVMEENSKDNRIYHNNFINNLIHVMANGLNAWNLHYPIGGNFWDDYEGKDFDNDGFGDQPYLINGGLNQDNFPFMGPDQWNDDPLDVTIQIPNEGFIDQTIYCNATPSGGYPSYSYYWDFGDNYTTNQQNPQHSYSASGIFNIQLLVTDAANKTFSVSQNIHIYPNDEYPPEISIQSPIYGLTIFNKNIFEINKPFSVIIGPVSIEILALDYETRITELTVTMNDIISESIAGSYFFFDWSTASPGQYSLNIKARDLAGNSAQDSITILKIF
jgi:parallel beta-helix repeat protein